MNFPAHHINRTKAPEVQKTFTNKDFSFLRPLAESVILQAMEDLLNHRGTDESIGFFQGDGFRLYAHIAGMSRHEKNILLNLMIKNLRQQRPLRSEKVKQTPCQGEEI
ncbi:MAG: hypothetical protein OEW04_06225 [Nitrospirota bacterium]|nr:hypothetical protein [Nitrospirota bacterium]